jgi:hypothetical protein
MDLLTSDQKNELSANAILREHLEAKIDYYVYIAKTVRLSVPKEFTDLDRVDFVIVWINKSDKDIIGIAGRASMSIRDVCEIYARAAVGIDEQQK